MRRTILLTILFSTLAVISALIAFAGSKSTESVSVNTAAMQANGSMGTARSSADTNQSIGCTVSTTSTGNQVNCYAKNAAGTSGSCFSTATRFITAANAITDHSEILFNWDSSGLCTFLQVSNATYWAPMVP